MDLKEIQSISTTLTDYLTDHGSIIANNGTYTQGGAFYSALSPGYVPVLPVNDHWGNGYRIYSRSGCNGIYGITDATPQDFVVASLGHDGISESGSDFVTNPGSGLFPVTGMESFNHDLAVWNGDWIRAPQTRIGSTGS